MLALLAISFEPTVAPRGVTLHFADGAAIRCMSSIEAELKLIWGQSGGKIRRTIPTTVLSVCPDCAPAALGAGFRSNQSWGTLDHRFASGIQIEKSLTT